MLLVAVSWPDFVGDVDVDDDDSDEAVAATSFVGAVSVERLVGVVAGTAFVRAHNTNTLMICERIES